MALYHRATVSPTKHELATGWLSKQPWFEGDASACDLVGAFRFDDPEGVVGMETHVLRHGSSFILVPMTYRDEPMGEAESALIGETEHSVLGTRWVYDGLGDARYLTMLAAVTLTGQGEALGMVVHDGEWFMAPTNVRIHGGGWSLERVSVDGFLPVEAAGGDGARAFRNGQFELTVHHRLEPGIGGDTAALTATWDGQTNPVLVAEVSERT